MGADLRAALRLVKHLKVKENMRTYPGKLGHSIPGWVHSGAVFHVRIRADRNAPAPLTHPDLSARLIESGKRYHNDSKWFVHLFLIMPNHIHALLSFPLEPGMSRTIGNWKRFHQRQNGVLWQDNYFDHRIRGQSEFDEKAAYIRRNPAVKGLCQAEEDWGLVMDCRSFTST